MKPVPSESETSGGCDEYVSGLEQQNRSGRRQPSTSQSPATLSKDRVIILASYVRYMCSISYAASIQASDDTASDGWVLIPLPHQSSLQPVAQKRHSLTREFLQEVRGMYRWPTWKEWHLP